MSLLTTDVRGGLLRDRRRLRRAEREMCRIGAELARAHEALGEFLGGYGVASAACTGTLSSERHSTRQAAVRHGRHGSASAVSSAGDGRPGRP
ncbi:MAG: hypothetical protein QOC64_1086 [Solirubrobacteraceae bacterium]|nr:hypothetical protein [Solirubrobacteraceae bacterium]